MIKIKLDGGEGSSIKILLKANVSLPLEMLESIPSREIFASFMINYHRRTKQKRNWSLQLWLDKALIDRPHFKLPGAVVSHRVHRNRSERSGCLPCKSNAHILHVSIPIACFLYKPSSYHGIYHRCIKRSRGGFIPSPFHPAGDRMRHSDIC